MIASGVGDPRPEMLGHEAFERCTLNFLPAIQWPPGAQRAEDAAVEEIELEMDTGLASCPPCEDRKSKCEE